MLDKRIQAWIMALRVAVRCVAAERRLADTCLPPPYAEKAFVEVAFKAAEGLAHLGEGIVQARRCKSCWCMYCFV